MPQVRLSAQPVEEARGASESQAAMSTARRAVGLPRASESRAALTNVFSNRLNPITVRLVVFVQRFCAGTGDAVLLF